MWFKYLLVGWFFLECLDRAFWIGRDEERPKASGASLGTSLFMYTLLLIGTMVYLF